MSATGKGFNASRFWDCRNRLKGFVSMVEQRLNLTACKSRLPEQDGEIWGLIVLWSGSPRLRIMWFISRRNDLMRFRVHGPPAFRGDPHSAWCKTTEYTTPDGLTRFRTDERSTVVLFNLSTGGNHEHRRRDHLAVNNFVDLPAHRPNPHLAMVPPLMLIRIPPATQGDPLLSRMRLRRTTAYCGTREHVQRDNRRTNFLKSVSAGIKGSHFRRCDRVPVPPEIAIWHTSALTAARSSGWTATYFPQL